MRHFRFELHRDTDVSGVSGEGVVACGWRLPFGLGAVMRWYGAMPTYTYYRRFVWISRIHGHNGATRVVWEHRARRDDGGVC
jgi:hypothetical protein